jgi:hypothetical protein
MYFRCDKNGDGKLSEDEVKEVRKKDPYEFIVSFFFFFFFSLICS